MNITQYTISVSLKANRSPHPTTTPDKAHDLLQASKQQNQTFYLLVQLLCQSSPMICQSHISTKFQNWHWWKVPENGHSRVRWAKRKRWEMKKRQELLRKEEKANIKGKKRKQERRKGDWLNGPSGFVLRNSQRQPQLSNLQTKKGNVFSLSYLLSKDKTQDVPKIPVSLKGFHQTGQ